MLTTRKVGINVKVFICLRRKLLFSLGVAIFNSDPLLKWSLSILMHSFAEKTSAVVTNRKGHNEVNKVGKIVEIHRALASGIINADEVTRQPDCPGNYNRRNGCTEMLQSRNTMIAVELIGLCWQHPWQYDRHNEVACLMLGSMTPRLYQQFEHKTPLEMYNELYQMYEKPPGVELQELIHLFHTCKQGDGTSVVGSRRNHMVRLKVKGKLWVVNTLTRQDQEASTTKERAFGKRRTVSPQQGGRTLEAELFDISSRVEKEEEWTNGCLYIFRDLEEQGS
uniref:Zinc finger, CCHC-type n=1 Tax=Tanacetum cinerariifolium TaxID=118510 RepID=A0A699J0V3_TANCI|nr:zinc finger, CCHC-type [Tanacetum cinerariifolium]